MRARRARDTLERAQVVCRQPVENTKQELIGQSEQRWRDAAIEGCYRSINLLIDLVGTVCCICPQRVVAFAIRAFMNKAGSLQQLESCWRLRHECCEGLIGAAYTSSLWIAQRIREVLSRDGTLRLSARSSERVHDLFFCDRRREPAVCVRSDVTDRL